MDVVNIFAKLTPGQANNMDRALRALFNFLESQGFDRGYLNVLRKNIPKLEEGFDVRVPSEEQIVASLKGVRDFNAKYRALYNLILDSGLRLIEGARLINSFQESETEGFDTFCMVPLGYFRKTKLAYYGFMTNYTMDLLDNLNGEKVDDKNASNYRKKHTQVVAFKYLRKFAFDKMIELDIPESVADFIQGRTPKKIGAKHYMILVRQAKKFYPRYAEHVTRLRQKALK
jgi:intergrase/recombinase